MGGNPFNNINPNNPMNSNRMGQAKNIINMFRNSNNPMQLFQQMAMRNPQMQPVLNMIRQGQNPDQIFQNVCKQRGINPQDIMNLIKG